MSDLVRAREFDCVECGRAIVQMIGFAGTPELCAACMMMPGWFHHDKIAALLDPGHDRNPPAHELRDTQP